MFAHVQWALDKRVLVALWLALMASLVGLGLVVAARGGSPLPGDLGISRELQERRVGSGVIKDVMVGASLFGYWPWAEVVVIVPAIFLLLLRQRQAALFLLVVTLADLLSAGSKLIVERPRPSPSEVAVYQQVGGYAFPSGHVVHYVAVFGALAYIALLSLRTEQRQWPRRGWWGLIAACAVLILLVGPSRVYLGAHWSSDVAGGYMLGLAWLIMVASAFRARLLARRSESPAS
ncbi:MAG TPA: phosphatase PAP2 family protein [Dehalococcoidia bacterium]